MHFSEALEVRPYQSGDEAAIVDLFELTFGRPLTAAYWQWRFRDNPTGRTMIEVAVSGSTMAAHYAVSPVVVSVRGGDVMTALSMTTMTHPEFRGRGLFVALAESIYKRMTEAAMDMVWGFPNVISHRGFLRELAWVDIHEVPTFTRILAQGRALPAPSGNIVELSSIDARFDLLWDEVKTRQPVLVRRDSRYLSWRYGANPDNAYTLLASLQGDHLMGYAFCKRYHDTVDLVDLLSVSDEAGIDLLWGVSRWAREAGARSVGLWLNSSLPLHHELEKYGFCNAEPITYFGARRLRPGLGDEIYDFRQWYLTMGDSDVY
jgi:Acetyltransferase (GNAT) domain